MDATQPFHIDQPTLFSLFEAARNNQKHVTPQDLHGQMMQAGVFPGTQNYSASPAPSFDPSSIQGYAKQKLSQSYGENPNEWNALYTLINNESGWNPNAQNPTSSAYGLGQFLDSTWQGVGTQKTSDPYAQVDALLQYIGNRYGSPTKALDFWQNVAPTQAAGGGSHWY